MPRGGRSSVSRPRLVRALATPEVGGSFSATLPSVVGSESGAVTIPSALYPNKPPSFVNYREFNGSLAVPSGIGSDRSIGGGWSMIYDVNEGGVSSAVKVTDGTAPNSPSDVWRMHFAPGTFGASHGVGNIYTNLSSQNIRVLYTSLHYKFSASYPWHGVSNKFLWWTPSQLLCQSKEGSRWYSATSQNAGQWLAPGITNGAILDTYVNQTITDGVYHQTEHLIDRTNGTWKIWHDGTLIIDARNITIADPFFQEFILEAYRGGGGETLAVDCYNYWDHIHLAWA